MLTKRPMLRVIALVILYLTITSVGYAVSCYESAYYWHRYRFWGCADDCSVQYNCCCVWECSLGYQVQTFWYCQAAGTCTWAQYSMCGQP